MCDDGFHEDSPICANAILQLLSPGSGRTNVCEINVSFNFSIQGIKSYFIKDTQFTESWCRLIRIMHRYNNIRKHCMDGYNV